MNIKRMIFFVTHMSPCIVEDISDKLVAAKQPLHHYRTVFHTIDIDKPTIVADIYYPFGEMTPLDRVQIEEAIIALLGDK